VSEPARQPVKQGQGKIKPASIVTQGKVRRVRQVAFSELSTNAKKLLELVPPDGVFIGNTSLQRKSKLGKQYRKVKDLLVDAGFLTVGKGRGGSVARSQAGAVPVIGRKKLFVEREVELYEPLSKWVADEWSKNVTKTDYFEVLVTGSPRNRERASGKWSRPDVTLVQVNNYEYLAQPVLEITTFEIKKSSDAEDIRSVFEAAAHSRWAHFSYLVVEVENGDYEFNERLISELERFNIGLVFMWKEKGTWQFNREEWESERLTPEPEALNALLETFFKHSKRVQEFKLALRK
jgi:hypothetical protein